MAGTVLGTSSGLIEITVEWERHTTIMHNSFNFICGKYYERNLQDAVRALVVPNETVLSKTIN